MNKRGLIKFIFISTAAFISFYFMVTGDIGIANMFGLPMIFFFLFALTIFMFFNMKKIKKNKFIYDVLLMLLMIFTLGCFLLFIRDEINCYFSANCSIELESIFTTIYPIFLFIMLLFGFVDIFKKTNKVNDILAIIASTLIILIHLRYYLEPNFAHKLIGDYSYVQESYHYVVQNYGYFIAMYLVVLVHYRVNRIS